MWVIPPRNLQGAITVLLTDVDQYGTDPTGIAFGPAALDLETAILNESEATEVTTLNQSVATLKAQCTKDGATS